MNKIINEKALKGEQIQLENLEKFNIALPIDIKIDLDDFDIGFI